MKDLDRLAERFEEQRSHLRAVAYRMLGSASEADDAVQEAWIRLSRSGADHVRDLRAWLTTVVGHVCLNMLRSRQTRREASLEKASIERTSREAHVPDPIIGPRQMADPEAQALIGDSVGLAMLVVLDALSPAERVAYVLHDVFGVPFDDIAPILDRSPTATRQLASRARRRVEDAPIPDGSLRDQWAVADAFLAASRDGDFERLLGMLDPEVVIRADGGSARSSLTSLVRGARVVAGRALLFRRLAATLVLVNGVPGGIAWERSGQPFAVVSLTIRGGRIVEIDILADPDRLSALDLAAVAS